MAVVIVPRLRLKYETYHEEYNTISDTFIVKASDIFDEKSFNAVDSIQEVDLLALKDASDIEIIPAALVNVRFAYIRVMAHRLAVVPAKGTISLKITMTDGGVDQLLAGKLFVIDNDLATITSIKVTNNEDDATGVDLPVMAILGGSSS